MSEQERAKSINSKPLKMFTVHDELIGKMVLFLEFYHFSIRPFCHFIDLQLLITTEMLSLSIKFHVSFLSHVIGVKHDCNVVIWPYFQSTPSYVQCAL